MHEHKTNEIGLANAARVNTIAFFECIVLCNVASLMPMHLRCILLCSGVVECCGHLSAFEIDGTCYSISPQNDFFWGRIEKNMNCKLNTVLKKGMTFDYEYDFGSTTELMITVVNYRIGIDRKEKLVILSRNNPIELVCDKCGKKPAAYMCAKYDYETIEYLCEDCAKTHECEEEMLFDVCNSPRMGVCGYCGSEIYPDQFVPDV